jgi:hypothetical protein
MRNLLTAVTVLALALGWAAWSRADDVKAVLDKAIKAHGGAQKLAKDRLMQSKAKGKIELFGGANFTQETVVSGDKYKETTMLSVDGQDLTVVTVFDGKEGWITANGQDLPLQEEQQAELKEGSYLRKLRRFEFAADKGYTVTALAEIKADGKALVGVQVSSKGHKDVKLYFDKDSGLLYRIDRKVFDPMAGQEVPEERIIKEYSDLEGVKIPKKMLVNRNGGKYLELEIESAKFLDKVNEDTFKKP